VDRPLRVPRPEAGWTALPAPTEAILPEMLWNQGGRGGVQLFGPDLGRPPAPRRGPGVRSSWERSFMGSGVKAMIRLIPARGDTRARRCSGSPPSRV